MNEPVNDPSDPPGAASGSGSTPTGTELDDIVRFYLDSGDYNGLPLGRAPDGWDHNRVRALVAGGLVQVVTDDDYPNMHIRPWPSRRTVEQQADDLDVALAGDGTCCLYPTPLSMKHRVTGLDDRPYEEMVAGGAGVLELVYFELAAVEAYRNDPRYGFQLDDFGFTFGIADDAYFDDATPEHDKIHTVRAGFAFDKELMLARSDDVVRYGCAFLTDLWRLSPRHQQRLKTWAVGSTGLLPHPSWWEMQMGEWGDHIGLFDKILGEMEALNEIWNIFFSAPLFRTTDRPREWGWLLRASTNEWEAFVHTTDKLLSDNLSKFGLDAAEAPVRDDKDNQLGTIGRLEHLLITKTTADPKEIRDVLRPLREVRQQRQRPAHGTAEPLTDRTVYHRQRALLIDVAQCLETLRRFMARQAKVRRTGWTPNDWLDKWLTL